MRLGLSVGAVAAANQEGKETMAMRKIEAFNLGPLWRGHLREVGICTRRVTLAMLMVEASKRLWLGHLREAGSCERRVNVAVMPLWRE